MEPCFSCAQWLHRFPASIASPRPWNLPLYRPRGDTNEDVHEKFPPFTVFNVLLAQADTEQ